MNQEKTTAIRSPVKKLIRNMEDIKYFFPRFEDTNVHKARARFKFHKDSDKYTLSKRLFVIEPSRNNNNICAQYRTGKILNLKMIPIHD